MYRSHSFARYNLYREGMTVDDYVQLGGRRADIKWDTDRGFIQLH